MSGTRTDLLAQAVRSAKQTEQQRNYQIPWKGSYLNLPVIPVRTEFLRYRISNGRTRKAQLRYLAANPSLPRDFFSDPEDEKVQKAQHEILLGMIEKQDLAYYLREEGQAEPAIVTADGYVVNGNRRLCALRNQGEEFMDVVVLPECAEQDLYDLELTLQMAPETKAEYDWVDELLHIRMGLEEYGETPDQIAKRMRTTREDILERRQLLAIVDEYLAHRGNEGMYHMVYENAKQNFVDLNKNLSRREAKRLPPHYLLFWKQFAFDNIAGGQEYRKLRTMWKEFIGNPDGFRERYAAGIQMAVGHTANSESPRDETPIEGTHPTGRPNGADGYLELIAKESNGEAVPSGTAIINTTGVDPRIIVEVSLDTMEDIADKRAQEEAATKPIETLRSVIKNLRTVDIEQALGSPEGHRFDLVLFQKLVEEAAKALEDLRRKATQVSGE